jgi:hypothetical protein
MTSEYITQIETENEELKKRVFELEESLKKYTSTHRQKKYYENHTEDVIQKNKEYTKKVRELYSISSNIAEFDDKVFQLTLFI